MDAPTAALIGGGVASVVTLASQFLAHFLSAARDRRNHRRERLFEVIVEAASALYGPRTRDDIPDGLDEEPKRGTMAALVPELRDPKVAGLMERTGWALTLLQVHFGHEHWLLDEYMDAASVCQRAAMELVEHQTHYQESTPANLKRFEGVAESLLEAQRARSRWTDLARAEVERG